jgi:cell division protein FtsW
MSLAGAATHRLAGAQDALRVDFWLLAAVLLLTGVGLTMVMSASGVMAERFYGDSAHFFRRQALFAVVGLLCMGGLAAMPRQWLFASRYLLLCGAVVLLGLTLAGPLSSEVNGASRWLRLGPVSLQPMEFAKPVLVVYLAWFFSAKQELVKRFSVGVIPPFAVTGLFCLLLLAQPDFGGAAMLTMLLFLMCLAGGVRFVYVLASMALAAGAGWLLIVQSAYRSRRMLAFLDPFKDALDTGYQLVQSLYALGSGGFWGVGLGAGRQKLFFLPEAHNDFIMAVLGEELGFLGVSLVFMLLGLLLWRAFAVSLAQQGLRDRLLGYGLTLILGLGALLNLAVVLGTAPPKGVPMPFLSYGGSSMLASFVCAGLLLNLSRRQEDA